MELNDCLKKYEGRIIKIDETLDQPKIITIKNQGIETRIQFFGEIKELKINDEIKAYDIIIRKKGDIIDEITYYCNDEKDKLETNTALIIKKDEKEYNSLLLDLKTKEYLESLVKD